MDVQTKYCVDCRHLYVPTAEETEKALSALRKADRASYKPVHLCNHPENLDKITKEMRPCSESRSAIGECGKDAAHYEPKV
jgi:hypothetical protein